MRISLSLTGCLVALLLPALAQAQGAQNYPSKTVTVMVASGAGGPADKELRLWLSRLSDSLGQPFVVEYKPGAGQSIGMLYLSKQAPDGHYLGTTTSNMPLVGLRYPDSKLDPTNGFEHISLLHQRDGLLVVHPGTPIHNIKEYVAYARAKPGDLNFSTSGPGSGDHIAAAWLMSATKTVGAFTFITHKNSPLAYADLLSGRIHMMSVPYSTDGPFAQVRAGKLRNIGTTSAQRSPMAPDVATLQEQGIPGYDISSFVGLIAPPKTPTAVINKLHAEIVKASKIPQLAQQLGEANVIVASTPAEAKRQIAARELKFRQLAQELNIDLSAD